MFINWKLLRQEIGFKLSLGVFQINWEGDFRKLHILLLKRCRWTGKEELSNKVKETSMVDQKDGTIRASTTYRHTESARRAGTGEQTYVLKAQYRHDEPLA